MIVLNNFYDTETKVQLSETGYKEILSNYPHADMEETIVLRPYETRVYYKEN